MSLVDLGLAVDAALQERLASGIEGAVEDGQEGAGVFGEDLAGVGVDGAEDDDVLELRVDLNHRVWSYLILSYPIQCYSMSSLGYPVGAEDEVEHTKTTSEARKQNI